MDHAVQLMTQHPALKYGGIFEIRPAADLNEMIKAREQRRRKEASRWGRPPGKEWLVWNDQDHGLGAGNRHLFPRAEGGGTVG